jgi:hypothetical protein
MKAIAWGLLVVLAFSAGLPYMYAHHASSTKGAADEFHFGVTYGFNTTSDAKLLIR